MGHKLSTKIIIVILVFSSLYALDLNQLFTTADNKFQVIVPDDWQILSLNDDADIQVGNEYNEQYLILISEDKTDLYGWNLQKHSYVTLGHLISGLNDPKVKGPFELKINNNPAIQYEIEGSTQGLRIVYLHTTVETDSAFNQLLAWTLRSKYNENKKLLQDVINTFKPVI